MLPQCSRYFLHVHLISGVFDTLNTPLATPCWGAFVHTVPQATPMLSSLIRHFSTKKSTLLASCLIYARALGEYVIFIVWVRSVTVREIRGK